MSLKSFIYHPTHSLTLCAKIQKKTRWYLHLKWRELINKINKEYRHIYVVMRNLIKGFLMWSRCENSTAFERWNCCKKYHFSRKFFKYFLSAFKKIYVTRIFSSKAASSFIPITLIIFSLAFIALNKLPSFSMDFVIPVHKHIHKKRI